MGLPYISHTEETLTKLGVVRIEQITQIQVSEFMHRYAVPPV